MLELLEGEGEFPGGAYVDQCVCGVSFVPFRTCSDRSRQATGEQGCPNKGKCHKVVAIHSIRG